MTKLEGLEALALEWTPRFRLSRVIKRCEPDACGRSTRREPARWVVAPATVYFAWPSQSSGVRAQVLRALIRLRRARSSSILSRRLAKGVAPTHSRPRLPPNSPCAL